MILEPDTKEIMTVVEVEMVELGLNQMTLLSNMRMELGKFLFHLIIHSVSCQEILLYSLREL